MKQEEVEMEKVEIIRKIGEIARENDKGGLISAIYLGDKQVPQAEQGV